MVAIGLVTKLISYTFVLSGFTMHLTYKKKLQDMGTKLYVWIKFCYSNYCFFLEIIKIQRVAALLSTRTV